MKKVWYFVESSALAFALIFSMSSFNEGSHKTVKKHNKTEQSVKKEGPTDPQIASIAVTANQVDIEFAKVALKKTKNAEVKQFAQTMVSDHGAVIDAAVKLAKKLGVTPENNPTTQSLLQRQRENLKKLNSLSGAAFDKWYVDNEVDYHKFAIGAVENILIPNASNKELKDLLQKALPSFKTHLEHATMLQKKLNK